MIVLKWGYLEDDSYQKKDFQLSIRCFYRLFVVMFIAWDLHLQIAQAVLEAGIIGPLVQLLQNAE
jgi:hypothetical protein